MRIGVAVFGATGSVGQRFVELLATHPWFEPRALYASERSAGRPYGEAAQWIQKRPLDPALAALPVRNALDAAHGRDALLAACPLVFSALDAAAAGPLEAALAARGHLVVSNARSHRMEADVPLVVAEVNPGHLALAEARAVTTGGAILTNPNCSTIGLVLALAPLVEAFGVERVSVVTLQAISGAGLPGVSAYALADNVIPFIAGEEEKLESEPLKIFGRLDAGVVQPATLRVSAQCNRVGVVDGHTLCVSVALARPADAEALRQAWRGFRGEPQRLALPSAPSQPIHDLGDEPPQPRLHRDREGGMATLVGRLRPCPLLDYRFVALTHNTLRGAAGGSILLAELAVAKGLLARTRLGATLLRP
jgi:aspartate-semialdehyde dehydrogenase